MNHIQQLFTKYGFNLESDNNAAELCDEIFNCTTPKRTIKQRHKRYFLVSDNKAAKYIKLESDLPFSIEEGISSLRESYPDAELLPISNEKAKKMLHLFK